VVLFPLCTIKLSQGLRINRLSALVVASLLAGAWLEPVKQGALPSGTRADERCSARRPRYHTELPHRMLSVPDLARSMASRRS
jgi:hypothetical protein